MKIFLSILLSLLVQHSLAGETGAVVPVTKVKVPQEVKKESKDSKIDFDLGLTWGVSNNPVQLPSDIVVNSSFYQLKPEISFEAELAKNSLFLMGNLSGDYKDFSDKVVSNIKSAFKAQLDLGLTYFLNPNHEVGVTSSGVYNKSSGLNFTDNGLGENGRDIEFSQSFYELYYSFNRPKYYIEISASQVSNKNNGLVQDDVAGPDGNFAEFKDDFDQTGLKLKLNYKLSEDSNVFIEPTYSKRDYKQRAARYTEGTTGQATNPKLSELHRGIGLGYKFDDSFVQSEVKGLFVKERDLIFKANTAISYGLEAKLKLPVGSLFKAAVEYSWAQRDFDFFVTNPQEDPTSRNLRKDVSQSWGLSVSKQLSKANFVLKYSSLNKDSNYKPFGSNIGSEYDEQIVSLGINLKL